MYQGLSSYFRTETAEIGEVRANLWNEAVTAETYAGEGERYQAAIFEQYKLYVEMADRISARRGLANGFFLSLNTGTLVAAVALFTQAAGSPWLLILLLATLLVQTGFWFWMIRSYRQLNAAKYLVSGTMEERLPASPLWRAEWNALGEGRNRARYWPMTHLEQAVPLIFAIIYVLGFASIITG